MSAVGSTTAFELFFGAVLREDRPVLDLLTDDYTFVNERLAKHYGIPGVKGDDFRRVDLSADARRGGVLTQASILTITSNPTRTSPVKVSGGRHWSLLVAGFDQTCGVASNGRGWCWGDNLFGELGNGTTDPSTVPIRVVAPM